MSTRDVSVRVAFPILHLTFSSPFFPVKAESDAASIETGVTKTKKDKKKKRKKHKKHKKQKRKDDHGKHER